MLKLYCEDGYRWDKATREEYPCEYVAYYRDSTLPEFIRQVKTTGYGGFHCPSCKKFPLKTAKVKEKEPDV